MSGVFNPMINHTVYNIKQAVDGDDMPPPARGCPTKGRAGVIVINSLFYLADLLVISRMNHEIALCMLAYRTDLRSLLTYYDVTAVRALPHHILVT